MRTIKSLSCKQNHPVLKVTFYYKGEITGWLSHPRMAGPIKIVSIPQLLFALEDILARDDMPIRPVFSESNETQENPIATLHLQIIFRQNHTWQGRIIWEEQQMEGAFQSVLELIQIMDEILAA